MEVQATKALRRTWLDIARGICIICMIMAHAFDWSQRCYRFIWITGTWFLVFFFFSSGLCFSNKYRFSDYIIRQAKKLLVPYFAVIIFYLAFRVYNGMWWDYSTPMKIKLFLAALCTALPSGFSDVQFFHVETIGIGPIWFLPCMFISGVIYKLLYDVKGKLIICVVLAYIAAASQKIFVLPFALQNACIGCMFIAFGDALKNYVFNFVKAIKNAPIVAVAIFCAISLAVHYFILTHAKLQVLNLGGNQYSLYSLISTFSGFLFLIVLAVLIERTGIMDEFLSFCGRETLIIVIFHTVDILIARNWSMRDNSFLIGTLLIYPFAVYIYKRMQNIVGAKLKLFLPKTKRK